MKANVMFDTLAYANKLKAAGVDPKAAEALAEVNGEMVATLLEGTLATKQDLAELETRLLVRLGAITVGTLTVATTILSVLHFAH